MARITFVGQSLKGHPFPERARAVKAAIDRVDSIRAGKERGAVAVLDQLDAVATQLEGDAGAATGRRDAAAVARRDDQRADGEAALAEAPAEQPLRLLDGVFARLIEHAAAISALERPECPQRRTGISSCGVLAGASIRLS